MRWVWALGLFVSRSLRRAWAWLLGLFASHLFRSWCMVGFYGGILVTGVLGIIIPSGSAVDALALPTGDGWIDHAAVVLWTLLYAITAPVGAVARLRAWYSAEFRALALIITGTILHAMYLISEGMSGVQTGVRLVSGVLALVAILSMLRELANTQRAGNLVVDPEVVRRLVREEVAASRTEVEREAP